MKHSAPAVAAIDAATAKRALTALRSALGKAWVFDGDSTELDDYRDAYAVTSTVATRPWAAVAPANVKQIQKVLEIARRYKLTLWPLSTARNLGYGGAAPLQAGALMLDLKRMKRVLEVNEAQAYAVVEPGVTYLALHRHLKASGSQLWIDSTASPWGGPLGNFLERGVGYTPYGQHNDSQCGLQVVLADGTLVDTASSAAAKTDHLYRYGYRAWVDGLFNQSNLGIVTRIGVQLMPAPAGYREQARSYKVSYSCHGVTDPQKNRGSRMRAPAGWSALSRRRRRVEAYSSGTSSSATILMILISGLMAGPAVSLYGSPTVSPVTAALCVSEPLPPK